ncbi:MULTISPECIES: GlcNAc-transferase family protein [Ramlibacter]|uniref:Glycosyltransferase (GlcNAc) n=1 Tax=Ramlibacter aquaticus TaxID=2780094 RepID=A0ABR9SBQ6_9BURK|nr:MULTISPECIES: GlcNAc-transferase family protein [Ramlibacter]MBE7939778.1 hypothetical protein [Ramlibacter aquaticus]
MSVFLSIASYCDPVLGFTLARAVAMARWPERLHLGVVDQSPADWPQPDAQAHAPARLSRVRIDPVHARGPCWARAIAMSLYDGEDWFLQVDSHMDFEPGWDQTLAGWGERLLPGRPGFVLSSYPNAFVFEGERPVPRPTTRKVLAHVVKPAAQFEPGHLVLPFEAHPVETDLALTGYHLGAGCLFAPGRLVQDFPYDPWYYFHGEEQALALRLFTHGWDIVHIPGLPLYHLYNTAGAGGPARPMHWDEAEDSGRPQAWWALEQRSQARLSALIAGEPLGAYGLGTVRSLADYARLSGIDFGQRRIEARAYAAVGRPALPA